MSELEQNVDFESETNSETMVFAMIDRTIDDCPQRAKQIFRDFAAAGD